MSAGSGWGSGDTLQRRVTDLERQVRNLSNASVAGIVASVGTFSLSTGAATSTSVSDSHVSGASKILYTPSNANGWSVDGALNGITPGSGSFSVSHQASGLTRTYSYIVINPV